MAYMNQTRKAIIAEKIKPILAKYGVKGSLRTSKHSITLTLRSGKIDFIGDMNSDRMTRTKEELRKDYAFDVNPYWFQEHYNGESYFFLKEALDALKSANWYDRSDAQTDYFDTAYYVNISVGNWKNPYAVTR